MKLKLLKLTGIAGGLLFLVLPYSEPPLKQHTKSASFMGRRFGFIYSDYLFKVFFAVSQSVVNPAAS